MQSDYYIITTTRPTRVSRYVSRCPSTYTSTCE